jgi:fructokinase
MQDFDCFVIGDVMFDAIFFDSKKSILLVEGGTCYCKHFFLSPGGAGNVAVGLSELGQKTIFVGKAGNDYLGRLYLKNLKKNRVVPQIFVENTTSTGVALTLSTAKERSFIVYRGANDLLSPEDVHSVKTLITRSKYLYFSGYSLANKPQKSAILEATNIARASKVITVFDPGAHNLIKSNKSLFTDLLSMTDVLSTNLEEARLLTSTNSTSKVIEKLRNTVPIVAIRCGKKGSIIINGEETVKAPAFSVKAKDPTGAGDAFTAALIHGLNLNLEPHELGKFTNWFAGKVVANYGSRSFPTKAVSARFLKSLLNAKNV